MSIISPSTIKVISESIGIANLSEDVAKSMAPDVEYRIREIVQEAVKFMKHSKRNKLTTEDINNALRLRNVESLYGFSSSKEPLTFSKISVPGPNNTKDSLFFVEDKELSFEEIIDSPLPKVPLDVTLGLHWLAVDGVQPAIPQNPAPSAQDVPTKKRKSAPPKVVPLAKNVLSQELQLYFDRVTSTIKEKEERQTNGIIERLSNDPGITQLVPYFTQFISDEVTHNLRDKDILLSLMKMTRALLESPYLGVEPYLHQLMPAILTCLVGKRLCNSPSENHWELRDYSAKLVALICEKFGNSYKSLQPRITKTLVRALADPSKPLTTHYGAVVGLASLGKQVIEALLIPQLNQYMKYLNPALSSTNSLQKAEATRVHEALLNAVGSYLYQLTDSSKQSTISSFADFKNAVSDTSDLSTTTVTPVNYDELYELFGESLIPFIKGNTTAELVTVL